MACRMPDAPRPCEVTATPRGARQLYPEWPLAATRAVERDLVVEVAAALMRIDASHPAGPTSHRTRHADRTVLTLAPCDTPLSDSAAWICQLLAPSSQIAGRAPSDSLALGGMRALAEARR